MGCLRKIVEGHDLVMQIKTDSVMVYESSAITASVNFSRFMRFLFSICFLR